MTLPLSLEAAVFLPEPATPTLPVRTPPAAVPMVCAGIGKCYETSGTWVTVFTNIKTAQQNAVQETVPPTAMLRQSVGSTARRALRPVLWESAARNLGEHPIY